MFVDTFEPGWISVVEAGVASVMCAYSSLCHDDTNTTCSLPVPQGYGRSHGVYDVVTLLIFIDTFGVQMCVLCLDMHVCPCN